MKTSILTLCAATIFLISGCENLQTLSDTEFNSTYSGDRLNRIAFPLGGMGAGNGISITFEHLKDPELRVGILKADEGGSDPPGPSYKDI